MLSLLYRLIELAQAAVPLVLPALPPLQHARLPASSVTRAPCWLRVTRGPAIEVPARALVSGSVPEKEPCSTVRRYSKWDELTVCCIQRDPSATEAARTWPHFGQHGPTTASRSREQSQRPAPAILNSLHRRERSSTCLLLPGRWSLGCWIAVWCGILFSFRKRLYHKRCKRAMQTEIRLWRSTVGRHVR
jgi:hypothetical protein